MQQGIVLLPFRSPLHAKMQQNAARAGDLPVKNRVRVDFTPLSLLVFDPSQI